MNSTSNQMQENGSPAMSAVPMQRLSVFDLVKVGLSSTFAVAIFFTIGYVVRHIAGPSTILSVLIATFIAYLAGAFYVELNTTIVLSAIKTPAKLSHVVSTQPVKMTNGYGVASHWLLSTYQLVHICNGDFAAFIIAWNLIMEYMVITALISKSLIIFVDAVFFGSVGHFTEMIPMSWFLSEYFDVLAALVPLVIGVPLMLLLRPNAILNVISIALSMLIAVIFLFFTIFHADLSNWSRVPENAGDNLGTGGFYANGVDGVFRGVVIILFMFIAFDTMIMSRWSKFTLFSTPTKPAAECIEHFSKTITGAILTINTVIFVCLLGMAFALTTIQPVHLMDKSIPLLSVVDVVFNEFDGLRVATRFIILIAGSAALFTSLYAVLHAEHRVLQTMLSNDADDSTFKLFGKFSLSHLQREIRAKSDHHTDQRIASTRRRPYACLLFSILSGLLAGLFAIEHLINLLSIGTLLALFAVTIDIMILRYSPDLKQRLYRPQANGTTTTTLKSTRSISLLTILLSTFCLLAATLTILIRIVATNAVALGETAPWIFISILIASLLVIVFILGAQPKGNAIFTLNRSHPMLPASVLFGCIYLCSAVDVAAWFRLAIWMTIGLLVYFFSKSAKPELEPEPKTEPTEAGVTNEGFIPDIDVTESGFSELSASVETNDFGDNTSIYESSVTTLNQSDGITVLDATKQAENVEIELIEMPSNAISKSASRNNLDQSKLDEISSVEDIKHTCIERREPNGTVYFVEVDLVQNTVDDDDPRKIDTKESIEKEEEELIVNNEELEKNMVERVLAQSEVEMAPKPTPDVIEPVELPQQVIEPQPEESDAEEVTEVRAIVHAPNELPLTPTLEQNVIPMASTSPGVIRPKEPTSRSPNFQIGVYEAMPRQKLLYEKNQDRAAFKTRLENLFGQNDEASTISRAKSNSPITPHALRIPALQQSISAPESLIDEDMAREVVSNGGIPKAPAFNQELYETVGRRYRKAFSTVTDVIDIDGTINDHQPSDNNKKALLSRTRAHENLADLAIDDDVPDIKQKLEHIFSKGRCGTDAVSATPAVAVGAAADTQTTADNNIQRSKRLEPFDTVRKQKMLFSDVLKSIGPDIYANLHPTQTTAAIDTQHTQRRESLD